MSDENSVRCYQQLQVWQLAMDVAEETYRLTSPFPKHELYGLCSQMQRAAVSIPSNIAEGHARDSTREFLHHISITFGSIAELETQLLLSNRLDYLAKPKLDEVMPQIDRVGRMLGGLQRSLKAKL
ncbi:MAG TPA: four helix bundle protein [Pirellulales bacterium]|jgi:four helix bundle protein|nr:four helix bundle protein [Pirellulales bacterium]